MLTRRLPRPRLRSLPSAHIAFSLLLAPALAGAADYYVATTGSDRNPGSEAQPFATIRQAASITQPGDNVIIRGGTYRQGVTVTRSGTAAAWITFSAYPGEVPVLDGGGGGGTGFNIEASFIRVEGLVAQNWSSSGFANGWDVSPGNVQFVHLVAENNGINGIAFYKNTGVLIEGCIVAHNGNQQPSWSSGVNLFQVGGTHEDNVVRRNVSFENIDISTNHTDGNGFILDEGSTGGLFENNIGFRNGGSCIRLTNSSGSHLINNTCFQNGLDPNNTPTFVADEIFFSDARTRIDTVVRNNLAVAVAGKSGLSHDSGTGASVFENNFVLDDGALSPFFASTAGALDLRVLDGATEIIDRGTATEAPATDSGFDFRCIRPAPGQAVEWWSYAPDYDYIRSVGGVAGCFSPVPRPQDGAPDIGAYELGDPPAPCAAADCGTNPACGADPVCLPAPDMEQPSPDGAAAPAGNVSQDPGVVVDVPSDVTDGTTTVAEPTPDTGGASDVIDAPETPMGSLPAPSARAGGGCSVPASNSTSALGLAALASLLALGGARRRRR